jgi:hypothetical protein
MNESELKKRLKEVFAFGITRKVFDESSESALDALKEAHSLSKKLGKTSFWPSVTAFRLAHLMFRNAKDTNSLEAIKDLLREATDQGAPKHVSIFSEILQIAVLSRLKDLSGRDVRLEQADIVRGLSMRLNTKERLGSAKHIPPQLPIQNYYFNLLELAVYFSGQDYSPLLGIGAEHSSPMLIPGVTSTFWEIVHPDGDSDPVHYDEDLARGELNSLLSATRLSNYYVIRKNRAELVFKDEIVSSAKVDGIKVLHALIRGNHVLAPNTLDVNVGKRTISRRISELNQILGSGSIEWSAEQNQYHLKYDLRFFGLIEKYS